MAEKKKEERKLGGYLAKIKTLTKERQARLKDHYEGEYLMYCGDPSLHWALGGFKRGRCNLLWGPTKSGKSTLALMWAAEEQKKTGGYVIIYDSEYNYDMDDDKTIERLIQCGLDPDKVIVVSSNDMNALFFGLADLEADIKNEKIKVAAIVVDSWGGVAVESAIKKIGENEISDAGNSFGGNAKFINPLIQFFLRIGGDYGVTCFFIQHCIVNMEQYGKRFLLIGGQKLRFLVHTSLFLETIEAADARLAAGERKIGKKEGDALVAVGKRIRAFCDKSRQLVEGRKIEFWFDFENVKFACATESLFELATTLGVITNPMVAETDKKGSPIIDKETGKPILKVSTAYFVYPANDANAAKWHGKPGVLKALDDKILFDKVFKDCMESTNKEAAVFDAPPLLATSAAEKED
jgi:RecA/RadA recombinase